MVVPNATAEAEPAKQTRETKTVTLITGDQVQVTEHSDGKKAVTITGVKGKRRAFHRQDKGKDVVLVPHEAVALVASGKLDKRLFNVSELIRQRYDDASSPTTPLIITRTANPQAAIQGATTTRALERIHGLAVAQRKENAADFWQSIATNPDITRISLDRKVKVNLDRSTAQIGAPAAWQAGYTGKGVKVAVLDTGIDTKHPDLTSAVVGAQDFTGSGSPADGHGHGTHVASIVAGQHAKYRGVAPDAKLLNGKVLTDDGEGYESWIVAGMEWAAAQGAKVVNLSLGGEDAPEVDALEAAVNDLTARTGTLFVIAAGNEGEEGEGTIGSPGSAAAALTVGAAERDDSVADFSSRGPNQGDAALKPDVTAPGVGIVAAKMGTSDHIAFSGTSMATPHVAGAAAIVAQQHPDWRPEDIKSALRSTAKPATATVWEQGTGRIDLSRATKQTVLASTVDFGTLRHPHDKPVTKTLTYTNLGDAPLTLAVTLKATGPITAGATQVTIPARGKAEVPLTVTPTRQLKGLVSATVTARTADGAVVVTSTAGALPEEEMFEVTIAQTNRDGKAPADGDTLLTYLDLDRETTGEAVPSGADNKVRLPKGTYHFLHAISTPIDPQDPEKFSTTLFGEPDVRVDRDVTLTFDARRGAPALLTSEHKGLEQRIPCMTAIMESGEGLEQNGLCLADSTTEENPFYAVPSRSAKNTGTFVFHHEHSWATPAGDLKVKLKQYVAGRIPATLSRTVPDSELAELREEFYRQGSQKSGYRSEGVWAPHQNSSVDTPETLPFGSKRRLLMSAQPWLKWSHSLAFEQGDEWASLDSHFGDRVYRAGESRTEKWYQAANGPFFTDQDLLFSRQGNLIGGFFSLYGDPLHDYSLSGPRDEKQTFSLYRGNTLIGTKTVKHDVEFEVPAAAADYRLVATATRTLPWSELSTTVTCEWGFRSAHVPGAGLVYTPLSVVQYAPPVDLNNQLRAGSTVRIPVTVQRQPRSGTSPVKSLGVEVSYDDGKTWVTAPLEGKNAVVTHPALDRTNGFVALRGTSADAQGNTVKQTILRAYRLS
ncbi:S8 family peptidase [Lentzea tibetensis]|nr:S8 family serine peptidase [Lentzea tibetensis]